MKIIKIDGGIGRVICSTGAIKRLFERTGEKIVILTSWPEIFENNPYVYKCYRDDGNIQYLFDDIIRHGDFYYPEPYFDSDYYNQRCHLAESFNFLINREYGKQESILFLTEDEKNFGKSIVKKAKEASGREIAVAWQSYGSGAILDENGLRDKSNRSMKDSQVKKIMDLSHDKVFLNISHIPINHPLCWQQTYNLRQALAVIWASDLVITIDSFVSHAAVSFDKKTMLILGPTYEINVGYPEKNNVMRIQKSNYPRGYYANRFSGFIDLSVGAMNFLEDEIADLINRINTFS